MNGGECIIGKLESAELQATANEIRVDGKQRSEISGAAQHTQKLFSEVALKQAATPTGSQP